MTKSLDKMTKSELLAHIASQDATIKEQSTRLCAAVGSYRALRDERDTIADKLAELETRRKFENQAFRSKLRGKNETKRSKREDWAALSREYCAKHNVSTVSMANLRAYAAAKNTA
jgi:hypothetical protein